MNRLMLMLSGLVVLACVLPAYAAADSNVNVSTLVVQGEGKVNVVPDTAVIVLGVETRNAKAEVAAAQNAQMMNKTIQALLAAGIKEENIQTSHYSLTTQTEDQSEPLSSNTIRTRNTTPQFIATNQVTARMNATDDVGKVLDAAITAGSNSIQSISFELNNSQPSMDAALKMAVSDAQRKAEVLSSAAGVKLGKIMDISGAYSYTSQSGGALYSLAAAAPTPVQAGQLQVTASVSMTYQISQ
jgi:uncharacterized protein